MARGEGLKKRAGAVAGPFEVSLCSRPPSGRPSSGVGARHRPQAPALDAQALLDLLEPQAEAGLLPLLQQVVLAVSDPLSTSLAFASNCACVINRGPLSSVIAARVTGLVVGASLLAMIDSVPDTILLVPPSPSVTYPCRVRTAVEGASETFW